MMDKVKVQKLIDMACSELKTAGISVTVTENGKHESFNSGYADIQKNKPMTEDTMLPIASATKSISAEAICILQDQGKIKLDDTVKKHIPEFELYDKYAEENLTIRDILCHRSGLPRHDLVWYVNEDLTIDDILGRLKHLKPYTTFRNEFYYQNMIFGLAGKIISKSTGMEWTEFVKENILDKIGMEKVNFTVKDLQDSGINALGYAFDKSKDTYKSTAYKQLNTNGPSGCINSTTKEMIKWIDLQLNSGKADKSVIVSEGSILQCHTPQVVINKEAIVFPYNEFKAYGLGWFVQSYRGHKLVQHGGDIDGFSTEHFFLPGMGFGASILTNTNYNLSRDVIMFGLIDIFLGNYDTDWIQTAGDIQKKIDDLLKNRQDEMNKQLKPADNEILKTKDISGIYSNEGYGDVIVEQEGEKTTIVFGMYSEEINKSQSNSLSIELMGRKIPVQFLKDLSGQVYSIDMELEPAIREPVRFIRK